MKISLFFFSAMLSIPSLGFAKDYNDYVLEAVRALPDGGKYSKLDDATIALGNSISNDNGILRQDPKLASPVYCSGASYQAFLYVISKLQAEGLVLNNEIVNGLLVHMQPDGTDSWGRWNSNGPGTSRLFYELGLGSNFVKWSQGKPGDFMKMFFNENIGKRERGHSVVYLGTVNHDGATYVKYWSSNQPDGRGVYELLKSKVVRVIFSRLETPEGLNKIPSMPVADAYLASMLVRDGTEEEMLEKIGLKP